MNDKETIKAQNIVITTLFICFLGLILIFTRTNRELKNAEIHINNMEIHIDNLKTFRDIDNKLNNIIIKIITNDSNLCKIDDYVYICLNQGDSDLIIDILK